MKFPYDTDYFPPAPAVAIFLGKADESFKIGPLPALVDSGADSTIIPARYLNEFQVEVADRKIIRSHWGEGRIVSIYLLDVGIAGVRLPSIEIVSDEFSVDVLIGRNILNKLRVLLDGPKQIIEISE